MIGVDGVAKQYKTSKVNYESAGVIIYLVEKLITPGFEPLDTGIVVPYKAQSGRIKEGLEQLQDHLTKSSDSAIQSRAMTMDEILFGMVNAMQGQERELFLFDFVSTL